MDILHIGMVSLVMFASSKVLHSTQQTSHHHQHHLQQPVKHSKTSVLSVKNSATAATSPQMGGVNDGRTVEFWCLTTQIGIVHIPLKMVLMDIIW